VEADRLSKRISSDFLQYRKKHVSWRDQAEKHELRKRPSWILGEGVDTLLVTEEIIDSDDQEGEELNFGGDDWKVWGKGGVLNGIFCCF
jgi:hypothetical protein